MTDAPRIGFICGSLRDGSINQTLKSALKKRVKAAGAKAVEISLATYDLPLFHGDLDMPPNAKKLAAKMKKCDGVIIVTPEYNGGLPPVLKNAIDWTSCFGTDQFTMPIYGMASCSPGPMSGIMCMRQLHYILNRVGAQVVQAHAGVGHGLDSFDAKGRLTAQPYSDKVDKMIGQMLKQIALKRSA